MDFSQVLKYVKSIRFWITISVIIHFINITNPPLEAGSVWRQCDGLMIARNFYEKNPNILYPMVDMPGDKTGIAGSEFPIFNYLIYILSLPFGFHDWFGRVINIIVSSLGIFFFYKTIKRFFGEEGAFYSAITLLVSLWFSYSRVAVPDTFAASLCLISIFYGFEFLDNGRLTHLIPFFVFALFGCLSKITSAVLLAVFIITLFDNRVQLKRKFLVVLSGTLVAGAVFCWYFIWVPYLNATYEFGGHFFMGQSFSSGFYQLIDDWPNALERLYNTPLKYSGFFAFVMGLSVIIYQKKWVMLYVFLLPFVLYAIFIINSGTNFIINGHYSLIILPAMAFALGCGLSLIKNKKAIAFLMIVVSVEGVANQLHIFQIRYPLKTLEKLEACLDDLQIERNELIAINSAVYSDPTALYFAHHKGWNMTNDQLSQESTINYLLDHKCKHIVIIKDVPSISASDIQLNQTKIYDSKDFAVYKIENNTN